MNCPTCDTPLEPGVLFCPNCGARTPAPSSAGAPTAALPPAYSQPVAPPPLAQPYDSEPAPVAPQRGTPVQPAYAPVTPPNSTAAVVSLVCGILSWLMILPVVGAIGAIIAGHIARNQIRVSGGQLGGSGMALAGLIMGYLQIALLILAICAILGLGFLAVLGSEVG